MNMPGFSAEASLNERSNRYQLVQVVTRIDGLVFPAADCTEFIDLCYGFRTRSEIRRCIWFVIYEIC
jgi:hypothetical protein